MSDKQRIIKVTWYGPLQMSEGDEIEITRGIGGGDAICASKLKNITNGRTETNSDMEHTLDIAMPKDIKPSIHGIVKEVHASSSATLIILIEGVGMLEVGLSKLVKEANNFLDKEIVEKCIHKKEAEDIVTSAFRILEERIRRKIGAGYDRSGVGLIDDAFNPKIGKLVLGKTNAEQEGLFHLYRGSIAFLRNPPSHRFVDDYTEFQILEIVFHVNLLLNLLEKSTFRSP